MRVAPCGSSTAKREFVHPWGAKFSEQSALELTKGPVTEEEIRDWQDCNEPLEGDRNSPSARRRAQYNVRGERQEEFIKTATPETTTRSGASKTDATPLSQKSASEVNVIASFVGSHQERQGLGQALILAIRAALLSVRSIRGCLTEMFSMKHLDNAALCEEQVDSDSADKVQITASEFVSAYASINVVNNQHFARAWQNYVNGKTSFADGFHCRKTPMCPCRHIMRDSIAEHELFCSETPVAKAIAKKEAAANFSCGWDGYSSSFQTKMGLLDHVRSIHKFEQKTCPQCGPGRVYASRQGYNRHMDTYHGSRWPTQCRYLHCKDAKQYNSTNIYRRHLQFAHGLKTNVFPTVGNKAEETEYKEEEAARALVRAIPREAEPWQSLRAVSNRVTVCEADLVGVPDSPLSLIR
ncbi:hypothetical protein V1527DRAFT_482433 [Lipomyces starkeyi]